MNVARVLAELAANPDAVDRLDATDAAKVLGALEQVRARLWSRVSRPAGSHNGSPSKPPHDDRMLDVSEAAEILGVEPRWLYDRSNSLPFARKLAPRTLRFSESGLYRWLESRS